MDIFIYGSNCNAEPSNIINKLSKYITSSCRIVTIERQGVNNIVIDYCKSNQIPITIIPISSNPQLDLARIKLEIVKSNMCLFFFSLIEPPDLNIGYRIALNSVDFSKIRYEFV